MNASLTNLLWEQGKPLFMIIDSARVPDVHARWSAAGNSPFESLYEGNAAKDLRDFAPYLGMIADRSLLERLVQDGWGRSWGVYLTCALSFEDLRRHLRKFLMVQTEEGRELYFRFYDPRVLRVFLPTCSVDQMQELFGPISTFWVESDLPTTCIAFLQDKKGLQTEIHAV